MKADLILTGGTVYAVDAARSRHEAVGIAGGRIVAVGPANAVAGLAGPRTTVVDLGGRFVLPGFIDSHMHASSAVEALFDVSLEGCDSPEACAGAVARHVADQPDAAFVRGFGWSDAAMPRRGPPAAVLDAVVPDKPVLLLDDTYHAAWLNSAGLRLVGIDASTPDPPNGVIERRPDGVPSGTLREGPCVLAVEAFPRYTSAQARAGVLHFQRAVAGPNGLTTVQDAGLRPGHDAALDAYEDLQRDGELTARYCVSLWLLEDRPLGPQLEAAAAERARHPGPLVSADWVKLFPDGVVEGHTAYLKQPYDDRPGVCGEPLWTREGLAEASVAASRAGFRLHYHAIGDAATAMSLDAVAAARASCGDRVERPLVTHLQLVDPADLPRFRELGVVAVPQPYWFLRDELYHARQVPYLGEERAAREYPMRSLWEHGAVVASASDYPVPPPPDPLVAIQRGVLRCDPGSEEEPLWPEEAVGVERMIESFTANGAYAMGVEREVGSIEPSKVADLVVLSRDITAVPPEEITSASVELTVFGGRPVYADGPFAGLCDA